MSEISEMDWAQHIKMDYEQNLRKDPTKAKQTTFRRFIEDVACPFSRRGIYNIITLHIATNYITPSI